MTRLAFVKQPWCVAWSWKSTCFQSARQMLDSFYYKTGCFSLLVHWRGDVWVMEESECHSNDRTMWEGSDPEAAREMWAHMPLTSWDAVTWSNYDIVVSAGRIVPSDIIQSYPRTLWVVLEGEHTVFRDKEPGEYDLFWDYSNVGALPYMVNLDIMRELIQPTNEAGVWLPSRMVRPCGEAQPETPPVELAGLPAKYPAPWNLGHVYRVALDGDIESPLDFWKRLGACRYLLNLRPGGQIGQPIIEAAALGLVVVSSPEIYDIVCHPDCRIETIDEAEEIIRKLEESPDRRQVVLDYQDRILREVFWQKPLAKLEKAISDKGKGKQKS
jgi:hypothetical protein